MEDDLDEEGEQKEELHIAVATTDGKLNELVYNDEIFWGTIFSIMPGWETLFRTQLHYTDFLTQRNNHRFEHLLCHTSFRLPRALTTLVVRYLHHHY